MSLKERFNKFICKKFGHNYCPEAISGVGIVHIRFRCRRCGKPYWKLYPMEWYKDGTAPYEHRGERK